jgi:hypothetical protein
MHRDTTQILQKRHHSDICRGMTIKSSLCKGQPITPCRGMSKKTVAEGHTRGVADESPSTQTFAQALPSNKGASTPVQEIAVQHLLNTCRGIDLQTLTTVLWLLCRIAHQRREIAVVGASGQGGISGRGKRRETEKKWDE